MKTEHRPGLGRLVLFALPFCAICLVVAYQAAQTARSPAPDWAGLLPLVLAALAFGGIGGGLIIYGRRRGNRAGDRARRRAVHPDQPWLWREDWARRRVRCGGKATLGLAWTFVLFWNLVSLPGAALVIPGELRKGNWAAGLAAIFPVVGLGLLVWAIRATGHWRKFGTSLFALDTLPAVIGGPCAGRIEVRTRLAAAGGVDLQLTCVHRTVTGRKGHRRIHERILWREEQAVSRHQLQLTATGTAIPVAFTIPYTCPETDGKNPHNQILWVLAARADLPGVDFLAEFEIPAFKTPESRPEVGASAPTAEVAGGAPPVLSCSVQPTPRGGTELFFPAARNRKTALGLTVFTAIWIGAIAFMVHLSVPVFLPIVFGLFAAFMVWSAIDLWLGTTRITIEAGWLKIRHAVLGIGRTRTYPGSRITRAKLEIAMQSGGRRGTPFYTVQLIRKDGGPLSVAKHLKRKREAEWLAAEFTRLLGLEEG